MQNSLQLERLFSRRCSTRPSFQTAKALLAALGNPQGHFPCIHVAGTNGKGSTCAMLAAILRAGGLKTALYTSPHLVRFNERCQINGENINDEQLAFWLERVEAAAIEIERRDGFAPASFFDLATAVAFSHFCREGVDIAVIETGLGGRWDATNLVTPLVAVITSIGLDHTAILGNTVDHIAAEKAGIIKAGVPVVISMLPPQAEAVISQRARELDAPLISAPQNVTIYERSQTLAGQHLKILTRQRDYGEIYLPLLGRHQLANCATAITTIETLADWVKKVRLDITTPPSLRAGPPLLGKEGSLEEKSITDGLGKEGSLGEKIVTEGLGKTIWPGRLQVISQEPLFIVDGAHNLEAARALRATLLELVGSRPLGLIVGFMADKDAGHFLEQIAPLASRIWAVELANSRAMREAEILRLLQPYSVPAEGCSLDVAVRVARDWAQANDGCICATGSLYLAGEILARS